MENSKKEIESFLYLYPSAMRYYDSIKYSYKTLSSKSAQLEMFYKILINIVDEWLNVLLDDEAFIIQSKYFKGQSYAQIAIETNYSNHSSIIKKRDKILLKIENYRRYYS